VGNIVSETVERVSVAIFSNRDTALPLAAWCDLTSAARETFLRQGRAAIESLREPDPHVIARAADRLGIAPSDATRLVGMWTIMIEEALELAKPSGMCPNQPSS
jgi:hypothetical protein